jgi:hypothetical protein
VALCLAHNIRAAWHGRFSGGCDYCLPHVGGILPGRVALLSDWHRGGTHRGSHSPSPHDHRDELCEAHNSPYVVRERVSMSKSVGPTATPGNITKHSSSVSYNVLYVNRVNDTFWRSRSLFSLEMMFDASGYAWRITPHCSWQCSECSCTAGTFDPIENKGFFCSL